MKIEPEQIQRVKESADIVEFIGQFVVLKKTGKDFKGLCPFHTEKTPSFYISPSKKIFKCWGCGASGDVIKFAREHLTLNFPEAVQRVANHAGIRL